MAASRSASSIPRIAEQARPEDDRPRRAIDLARVWARGEITWWEGRTAAGLLVHVRLLTSSPAEGIKNDHSMLFASHWG